MKEPENLRLRRIREIRDDLGKVDTKVDKVDAKVDKLRSEILAELRGLRKYIMVEAITSRYATVGVDGRLEAWRNAFPRWKNGRDSATSVSSLVFRL